MKQESRELWEWIWSSKTSQLEKVCDKYDKKMGLKHPSFLNMKHYDSKCGDMDL